MNESTESMIRKVYMEQKKDSKKGDFISQIKQDMKDIKLEIKDEEVETMSKWKWKNVINEKVESAAFEFLIKENAKKEKTGHILFDKLEMNEYLIKNKNTKISKTIYSIRAGVFDIKALKRWKYKDNLCVDCNLFEENMKHFMQCPKYGRKCMSNWELIYENSSKTETKVKIAKEAQERYKIRSKIIDDGPGSLQAPTAPLF